MDKFPKNHNREIIGSNREQSLTNREVSPPDNTGRVCRGIELDPLYVDVIVRRYEATMGNHAVLMETGETFEALAVRRAH